MKEAKKTRQVEAKPAAGSDTLKAKRRRAPLLSAPPGSGRDPPAAGAAAGGGGDSHRQAAGLGARRDPRLPAALWREQRALRALCHLSERFSGAGRESRPPLPLTPLPAAAAGGLVAPAPPACRRPAAAPGGEAAGGRQPALPRCQPRSRRPASPPSSA